MAIISERNGSTRTRSLKQAFLLGTLVILAGAFSMKGFFGESATSAPARLGINVEDLERATPANLPVFEDYYQRYYGVLDQLK